MHAKDMPGGVKGRGVVFVSPRGDLVVEFVSRNAKYITKVRACGGHPIHHGRYPRVVPGGHPIYTQGGHPWPSLNSWGACLLTRPPNT